MRNRKQTIKDLRAQAANEHRQRRRLQTVNRLMQLLHDAVCGETREERELRRLKEYLLDWKRWTENWRPKLGMPRAVPYLDRMRPSIALDLPRDEKDRPDPWAMGLIDTSIEDLAALPDGAAMRAALRVRMLNEAVNARVFRHGVLRALTSEAVDELADQAEAALVPIVKAKGLPL